MLKVDFEKLTFQMEDVIFVKKSGVKKISNTCFFNVEANPLGQILKSAAIYYKIQFD
jgi:hypothetical protein